jgi:hypothetical protein
MSTVAAVRKPDVMQAALADALRGDRIGERPVGRGDQGRSTMAVSYGLDRA